MVKTAKTNRIYIGQTSYLLLPNKLIGDSNFPFNLNEDKLKLSVRGNTIVIHKEEIKND